MFDREYNNSWLVNQLWSAVPQDRLWDQAEKITTVAHCLEWLSLNDDVQCTMHNNYPEGASDTERSNRLMQETRHFPHCAQQLTLTPSGFLLSKLLAAAEGDEGDNSSVWEFSNTVLGLRLHYHAASISVDCAYLQTPGAKIQQQNPLCSATDALSGILIYARLLPCYILIHTWRANGWMLYLTDDERHNLPISSRLPQHS